MPPVQSRQEPLMLQSRYSVVFARALGASAVLFALLYACREVEQPSAPSIEARNNGGTNTSKNGLCYACGNQFRATNGYPSAVTATYTAVNTPRQGKLSVRAK